MENPPAEIPSEDFQRFDYSSSSYLNRGILSHSKFQEEKAMGIIAWLVVGLIAGWLAGMVMKGGGYGVVGDIIVGILGALLGGFLAGVAFGGDYVTGINLITLLVS